MNEQIAKLATYKKFEALDETQQKLVLSELTEGEYRKLSTLLGALPLLDIDVAPPPHLKSALLAQLDQPNMPGLPTKKWYMYPVALWQTAAAVLVAVSLASWWETSPGKTPPATAPTVVVQMDTVVVEKIMWKERLVVKTIKTPVISLPVNPDLAQQDSISTLPPSGTSKPISAQPELLQFFTRAGEK